MATPFNVIYDRFLNKITDYDFISLQEEDLEQLLYNYLISSIVRFKTCKNELSDRDNTLKQFNKDLTDEEIEILATQMIEQWLSPRINTLELIQQSVSTKDFTISSQANQLKELRSLKQDIRKEISQLITSYTYSSNRLEDLL